jgi:hypothetical protein
MNENYGRYLVNFGTILFEIIVTVIKYDTIY